MTSQNRPTSPDLAPVIRKRKSSVNVRCRAQIERYSTFSVGDVVKTADFVKPKQYAKKRGEIQAINEGEFRVRDAWFAPSELIKV